MLANAKITFAEVVKSFLLELNDATFYDPLHYYIASGSLFI